MRTKLSLTLCLIGATLLVQACGSPSSPAEKVATAATASPAEPATSVQRPGRTPTVKPAVAGKTTAVAATADPDRPKLDGTVKLPSGVTADFTDIDLNDTDAQNFEKRLQDVTSGLISIDGDVERNVLIEAYKELGKYKAVGGTWRSAGPSTIASVNMPQGQIPSAGKINAFAIDPRDTNVVYAAASFGGIWKTTDGGANWQSLTDRQVPMVYGGIEMDPKNPDVLYALLGEFAPSMVREYGYLANGIMRSTDAGRSWKLIGSDVFKGSVVTALAFDSKGDIYAASGIELPMKAPPGRPDFGVFQSSDRGETWTRLLDCGKGCTYQSGEISGGFFSLAVASDDTLYAVRCSYACVGTSIVRSSDGGQNWDELDYNNVLQAWEKAKKVKLLTSRYTDEVAITGVAIAVAKSNPQVLLAGGGLYYSGGKDGSAAPASFAMRSIDGGNSWELLPGAADYCTGSGHNMQCSYDNIVAIDPTDAKIMYLGGSFSIDKSSKGWSGVIQRSADGGKTWHDTNPVAAKPSWMHPDSHGFRIDPNNHNLVWVGTDGGIYRTDDASKPQPEWVHLSGNINTLLFIGVGLHPTDRNYMIGGLQDNAIALTTDGGKTWPGASQGDMGYTAIDPFNPDIVYSTWPKGGFARNEQGGTGGASNGWEGYTKGLASDDRFLFYAPFVVDPKNEGVLYIASQRVYKTTDRGDLWKPISEALSGERGSIRSLAISASDPEVLYAGTTEGRIWISTDGGSRWQRTAPKILPTRQVNRIAVDPTNPQVAVAVFGGFDAQTPYAKGHIFRTIDGGKNWQNISYNLPDAPIGAIVIDARPKYAGIYIGGSLGVWVLSGNPATDVTKQWAPYGTGMPYTLVSDIQLNTKTGIMAAATYGRSIWTMEMP
jgi:photosystem II stability/assembly factor-like uncharacterized protein